MAPIMLVVGHTLPRTLVLGAWQEHCGPAASAISVPGRYSDDVAGQRRYRRRDLLQSAKNMDRARFGLGSGADELPDGTLPNRWPRSLTSQSVSS